MEIRLVSRRISVFDSVHNFFKKMVHRTKKYTIFAK